MEVLLWMASEQLVRVETKNSEIAKDICALGYSQASAFKKLYNEPDAH